MHDIAEAVKLIIMDVVTLTLHSYGVIAIIVLALFLYAKDTVPMELTAIGVMIALMLLFYFAPLTDERAQPLLSNSEILAGFANPAVITVVALLIMGQGIATSGVLEAVSRKVLQLSMGRLWLAMLISLISVLLISAFLNNIPVVIIFIPIIQTIAQRFQVASSKLLMPLSFIAVLGGMTTLVGSSTNLLVSQSLVEFGYEGLHFFEFTAPGLILACAGLVYVMVIAPYLLPERKTLSHRMRERSERGFLAEVRVCDDCELIGRPLSDALFAELTGTKVRLLHRYGKTLLPPFHMITLQAGDYLSISTSRANLTSLLASQTGLTLARGFAAQSQTNAPSEEMIVEMMVTPSSGLDGQTIKDSNFETRHKCEVLGFQHRARMVRSRLNRVKLSAGDMILVKCDSDALASLRDDHDVVLVEFSIEELPNWRVANRAIMIFLAVMGTAAFSLLPLLIAALLGALAMVACSVMSLQQAIRSIDIKIVTTIAAALALGKALQVTGAAAYLAYQIVDLLGTANPSILLSAFFLMVAILANIVSTKTCAVLFAPIGLQLGAASGVDPRIFAITVIFAANCAFATPFAYQTSLLVMGPGSYKFTDYLKVGVPLLLLVWGVFSFVMPRYFGL